MKKQDWTERCRMDYHFKNHWLNNTITLNTNDFAYPQRNEAAVDFLSQTAS